MESFDRGSTVLVQVEFKRNVPFGDPEYFDPTTPKITIYDAAGLPKVTDADLQKQAVGKYYYICQTAVNWATGIYSGKSTGSDGSYSDVTTAVDLFVLK